MQINKPTSQESKTLVGKIVNKMEGLNKARKNFIISTLLLYLSMRGRYTFLGLERYGDYCEKTYRDNYEKPFDFATLNWELIKPGLSDDLIVVFDPSYIPKSGKSTPHLGKYWSGCLGKALKGLEIGILGVVDVKQNTAYPLKAVQTLNPKELQSEGLSLVHYYSGVITNELELIETISKYLVVDGYFTKKTFVYEMSQTNMELISKLRKDANLRHYYTGPYSGRGRPKVYDKKINLKKIDKRRFKKIYEDQDVILYQCICNVVNLKMKAKIVYAQFKEDGKVKQGNYAVYMSTDLELSGLKIYRYYKARYQIEFVIRDGKQHTGLTHCQARSANKLDFHFNASLTAINLAKVRHFSSQQNCENQKAKPFSMADVKTLCFNELMLDFFFSNFQIDPNLQINKEAIEKARKFGTIAA